MWFVNHEMYDFENSRKKKKTFNLPLTDGKGELKRGGLKR